MSKSKQQAKYKKAPQAPRRFKSSYMFFSTDKHKLIREELSEKGVHKKISTTEVAKMVSKAWKNLSDEEREDWEEMARLDKARYEMEKSMYSGPWKVPAKKRSQKDPSAPKRPMSAFLSFSNSKRAKVKIANPDIGNAEISRLLAQMWKDAAEVDRKDHIDKEFSLRQKYKVAIAEWRRNSESEMNAARKAREDEAMKAVLAIQEGTNTDYGSAQGEHPQNTSAHQNHREGSHLDWAVPPYHTTSNTHTNMQAYPQHYGYGGQEHYGYGGHANPGAPPMDPGSYSQGQYYDRGTPYYDGYGQPYGQGSAYPQTSEYPPHPIDPHQSRTHYQGNPYGHSFHGAAGDGNGVDVPHPTTSGYSYGPPYQP